MKQIDLRGDQMFFQLEALENDKGLLRQLKKCVEAQRAAGQSMLETYFKPNPRAYFKVSAESLQELLGRKQKIKQESN